MRGRNRVEIKLGLTAVCSRGFKSCAGDGEEGGTVEEGERARVMMTVHKGKVNHSPRPLSDVSPPSRLERRHRVGVGVGVGKG